MSNGKILPGQLRFGQEQILVPYTEQMCDITTARSFIGNALAEITPYDEAACKVRLYETPDLSGFWFQSISYGSVNLPPVLSSLSVAFEKGGGDGDYTETGSASAVAPFGVGLSLRGSAQASAFCIPKLIKVVKSNNYDNLKLIDCYFYSPTGTLSDILARLTTQLAATVLAWPLFKSDEINLVLTGMRSSGSGQASFQASASDNNSGGGSVAVTNGGGDGYDISISIENVEIPATLHGAFTLTGSDSISKVGAVVLTVGGSSVISGGASEAANASATGSVTPTSIAATTPTALPTSGLYLYKLQSEPAVDFNNHLIHAVVFDFAQIA